MSHWIKIQDTLIDLQAFHLFAIRLRYNDVRMSHQFLVTSIHPGREHSVDIALFDTRSEAVEVLERLSELLEAS